MLRWTAVAATAAAAMLVLGAAGAVAPPAVVSGPSPFAMCTTGDRGGGGRAIADYEVEPTIAVDPAARRNVVIAYQQDRWSDGQARGIVVANSRDGGRSWKRRAMPFSRCASPRADGLRSGDPWLSAGRRHTVWLAASGNGIVVSLSRDGGAHWSAPRTVYRNTRRFFADKPTVTSDPVRAATAYVVWARIVQGPSPVQLDALFSQTNDFGRTWSRPKVLIRHTERSGPVASQVLVDSRRHTLYHLTNWEFDDVPGPLTPSKIAVQRSTSGGRAWSRPKVVAVVRTLGYQSIDRTHRVRSGAEGPFYGIDPRSGRLHAVWQDYRFSSGLHDEIAISSSADGGRMWTRPRRVNARSGKPALIPTLAVSPAGRIAISYYDFARFDPRLPRIPADYVLAVSDDHSRSFRRSTLARVEVSLAPSVNVTGGGSGHFLGDYMGLVAGGRGFSTAYVTTNEPAANPTDVVFAQR